MLNQVESLFVPLSACIEIDYVKALYVCAPGLACIYKLVWKWMWIDGTCITSVLMHGWMTTNNEWWKGMKVFVVISGHFCGKGRQLPTNLLYPYPTYPYNYNCTMFCNMNGINLTEYSIVTTEVFSPLSKNWLYWDRCAILNLVIKLMADWIAL